MAQDLLAIDDRRLSLGHHDVVEPLDVALTLDRPVDYGRPAIDAAEKLSLRRAYSMFPTGVVAMCALDEAAPVGITVNSFTSVSLDPPLVSVCIVRSSFTWSRLSRVPRIGLSVLSAEQEWLSRQLSARDGPRFSGVDFVVGQGGSVLIPGGALWLECSIRTRFDGGDHEIVLLEVLDTTTFPDVRPLVFHQSQYQSLA